MKDDLNRKISKSIDSCMSNLKPHRGDCGNIASALVDFFDDADLVSISNSPQEHNSVHFCVRINDELYDGYGRTTTSEIVHKFSDYNENMDRNPEEYLYEVQSVSDVNYPIFSNIKNEIIENLEKEFNNR